MSSILNKQTIYDKMPKWNLFLNMENEDILNTYLDGLLGNNKHHSIKDRLYFIDYLYKSMSLSIEEKKRVIGEYGSLLKFQLSELLKVFKEEQDYKSLVAEIIVYFHKERYKN